MGHWILIKEQNIDGEVEIFDSLSVSLKRREYANNSENAFVKRITLIGYPNSLKIILNLNKKLDVHTLVDLCNQVSRLFPIESDPTGYSYLSFTLESTEEGRERLFKFLSYIHEHIEAINPKEIMQDIKEFLGVKTLLEGEDTYQEILNVLRNDDIPAAKRLADKAYKRGYISAYYTLGCALYLNQNFTEAFDVLNKVPNNINHQQQYYHANELLAKIVLKIKLPETEERAKYILAFNYANKAGSSDNALNLRESIFMEIEQQLRIAHQKIKELEDRPQPLIKLDIAPGFHQFKANITNEKPNQSNKIYQRLPPTGFLPPIVKAPQHGVDCTAIGDGLEEKKPKTVLRFSS